MTNQFGDAAPAEFPFAGERPIGDMSLTEIAQALEQVTGWIEAQRSIERDARTQYQAVAQAVDAKVSRIREYAQELVRHQQRRMASFDSFLGSKIEAKPAGAGQSGGAPRSPARAAPRNLAQAIVEVWGLDKFGEALTTEEIAAALPEVGYKTDAAPASLRSSVNQALAKLCRVGTIVRLRADGSVIPPKDKTSRARKYLAATRLPEDQVL